MLFHPLILLVVLGVNIVIRDGANPIGFFTEEACNARLAEMVDAVPGWLAKQLEADPADVTVVSARCIGKPGTPA